jgi:hypothetical protein
MRRNGFLLLFLLNFLSVARAAEVSRRTFLKSAAIATLTPVISKFSIDYDHRAELATIIKDRDLAFTVRGTTVLMGRKVGLDYIQFDAEESADFLLRDLLSAEEIMLKRYALPANQIYEEITRVWLPYLDMSANVPRKFSPIGMNFQDEYLDVLEETQPLLTHVVKGELAQLRCWRPDYIYQKPTDCGWPDFPARASFDHIERSIRRHISFAKSCKITNYEHLNSVDGKEKPRIEQTQPQNEVLKLVKAFEENLPAVNKSCSALLESPIEEKLKLQTRTEFESAKENTFAGGTLAAELGE